MRHAMQVLIVIFGVLVVAGGGYIGFALLETEDIINSQIPASNKLAQGIGESLQSYSVDESKLRQRYPVAEPTSWSTLITDAVTKAGLAMRRISIKPPQPLKGSEAQILIGNIEISSPQLSDLLAAASNIEKINSAVAISRFEIQPRSTEDAPFNCFIEVTIYEHTGGVTQPTTGPEESASPENTPTMMPSVPPPPGPIPSRPPMPIPTARPTDIPPPAQTPFVPIVTPPHTGN
ncbi:MAG: hypothetical protein WC712_03210 [Candidatus Brocadiia bacterium]